MENETTNTSHTTILKFLINKNPKIERNTKARRGKGGNTTNVNFHTPKKVSEWTEFRPSVLSSSLSGAIEEQAQLPRTINTLKFPTLDPTLLFLTKSHAKTVNLINGWSGAMVNEALRCVGEALHPALWVTRDADWPQSDRFNSYPAPIIPDENGDPTPINVTEKRTKVDISGFKEDAGACVIEGIIAADRLAEVSSIEASDATLDTSDASLFSDTTADTSVESDTETPGTQVSDSSAEGTENAEAKEEVYAERFPKEYKQYMLWSFDKVLKNGLFDTDGAWTRGRENSVYAWPIRQAFSYSLKYRCRYGCIMSSHEAFIFRIKPIRQEKDVEGLFMDSIEQQSLSKEKEREMMEDLLISEIADNGEMQYVCIPWSNDFTNIKHTDNEPNTTQDSKNQGVEKVTDIAEWTINLAFWYLHMMVGSNYKVKWRYEDLVDEKLQPLSLAARNLLSSTNQALELKRRGQQDQQHYQPRGDQSDLSTPGIDQNQSISLHSLQEQDEALQECIATSTLSPTESNDSRSDASSMTERQDESSDNEAAPRKRRRGNNVRSSPPECRPEWSFYKASFE